MMNHEIKERLDAAGVAARSGHFDEAIAKCKEAVGVNSGAPKNERPDADWILQNTAMAYNLKGDLTKP